MQKKSRPSDFLMIEIVPAVKAEVARMDGPKSEEKLSGHCERRSLRHPVC